MYKLVTNVLIIIPVVSEPSKAIPIQIHHQWLITNNQDIQSNIKLLTSNNQRVTYILLYYIGFSLWRLRVISSAILPLRYLLYSIENENAFALGFTHWLHYP